jgi:aspartyl-tRNA(Asn)/glutamyl-tRNA(Gln) amidotransferase subunit A
VFDEDATVIRRLREAGAVLTGKLAMVEIAGGMGYRQANASFTGPGLNSWDTTAWSGGSSSGSGAAVGAGLVPFAIGSETWGSIMSPAGYCGVAGLRPTYGRVSRHGAMALSWTMDKLGVLGRTADDCGLVLDAIAGHDPADATSVEREFRYPPDEEPAPRYRMAILKNAATEVQPEVRANFERSLGVLAAFADFDEVELPDLPYTAIAGTFIACEMAAAFEGMVTSGDIWELTAPEDHVGPHAALLIPAKDYLNAMRIRPFVQRALDEILARYDALVTPTLASVAPPIAMSFSEYHRGHRSEALSDLGGGGNAAGIPALSVPNGFGERGLPTGLQFVGRAFEENKLVAMARRYQAATDWHTKHPEV